MNIKLPIVDVDNLVDLVLSKKAEITYRRTKPNKLPKTIYTVKFKELDAPPWNIQIRKMTDNVEITFPLYVPSFDVIPAKQIKPGAMVTILDNEKEPVYDSPVDQEKYKLCCAIFTKLRLRERELQGQLRPTEDNQPNLKPSDSEEHKLGITLQELANLEEKAIAGDTDACHKLDILAREEGYDSWESQSKEISKILGPVIQRSIEVVEKEKSRRESTPGVMPIFALLIKMLKSSDPVHRAIASQITYRDIYKMGKKLEEELFNSTLMDDDSDTQNIPKTSNLLPERRKQLDELSIKWVNRGSVTKRYNCSEFLVENSPQLYVTVPEFKRHLRDACKRGLIHKNPNTGRFIPKSCS